MADLLSLLVGIPSLMADFNGSTTSPYQGQQQALAEQQARYAQAAGNPDNPLYKKTYDRYQNQNRMNLADVIAEAQGQNRLASSMGRTPLFNQERGGENLFRTMVQQYQGMGAQSDQQTQAALRGAGQLNNAAQAAYGAITPTTAAANKQQLYGYGGIADLLRGKSAQTLQAPAQTSDTGIPLQKKNDSTSSLFSGLF